MRSAETRQHWQQPLRLGGEERTLQVELEALPAVVVEYCTAAACPRNP